MKLLFVGEFGEKDNLLFFYMVVMDLGDIGLNKLHTYQKIIKF